MEEKDAADELHLKCEKYSAIDNFLATRPRTENFY